MPSHHHDQPGIAIRAMQPQDADQVLTIYQHGLDTGHASFETTAPTWQAFDVAKLDQYRYVATDPATDPNHNVLGWIAASPVSDRCCYAGVVEHSIYVSPHSRGLGIGAALLTAFIAATEADDIWTIQTGIFPENTPSLRLHARAGFRTVGTRQKLGRLHGQWRDVVLLERRSPTVL
ncbi:GNAT family N-acetyltransferase [Actinomadura madurae]|uniref:GNAT family N-acetyltransferase n=2 Tax=Actinomadura madurae TaxID=1993 RepID=UPI0020D22351|nr:GNAT family N-acetyltransferase [Actinomadura madurae]MCP9952171.1 N-acetyltransferase family protein [Actinomadura madurae]MCP9968930.1 N-acetyltransferase family protein [Actinomadura madurae]MCP9981403.1 N-acetyltransferase family protein [Actinomadura madurae]MCQ0007086.1 N-acetyltransferase family protein [Actinomadura madurae]MCQ0017606.1 N-acetyltransferase family protein [Actinomadura madurae]